MSLSFDETKKVGRAPLPVRIVTWLVTPLMRLVWVLFPPLRRRAATSVGGLSGRLFRLRDAGRHAEALSVAFELLDKLAASEQLRPMWWMTMVDALPLAERVPDEVALSRLEGMLRAPPTPPTGFHAAWSLVTAARRASERDDRTAAADLARQAAEADRTWIEGPVHAACYAHALERDATEFIRHALVLDPNAIHKFPPGTPLRALADRIAATPLDS